MTSIEKVERIYDSYSGVYDLIFKNLLQPGRERAVSALGMHPGERVLEVGVGTGLSLPYFPPNVNLTGIDISSAMLRIAGERAREIGMPHARFLRMGAEKMDLPDASFDRVLAIYVLSTVGDPAAVLRELGRVCRPEGRVVILNHFRSRNRLAAFTERVLTPLSRRLGFVLDLGLEQVFNNSPFVVERVQSVNIPPLWSMVELRRGSSNGHGSSNGG
jgi:phosphatidylethanolamine/phosphatidyl-N-methylethanolamine N-methyltransferase